MPNPRPPIIAIRPRKGTKLHAEWQRVNHNQAEMREIVHSYAEQFARLARESDNDQ